MHVQLELTGALFGHDDVFLGPGSGAAELLPFGQEPFIKHGLNLTAFAFLDIAVRLGVGSCQGGRAAMRSQPYVPRHSSEVGGRCEKWQG